MYQPCQNAIPAFLNAGCILSRKNIYLGSQGRTVRSSEDWPGYRVMVAIAAFTVVPLGNHGA